MEKIKIGDWVVDDEGDICQVERIDYDTMSLGEREFTNWVKEHYPQVHKRYIKNKENQLEPTDEVWGHWKSGGKNPHVDGTQLLCTERRFIKGVYPNKEVAMIHASVISADLQDNGDDKE